MRQNSLCNESACMCVRKRECCVSLCVCVFLSQCVSPYLLANVKARIPMVIFFWFNFSRMFLAFVYTVSVYKYSMSVGKCVV